MNQVAQPSQDDRPVRAERALRVVRQDGSTGEWIGQVFVRNEDDGHVTKVLMPATPLMPRTSWWQVAKLFAAVMALTGLLYWLTAR